MWDMGCEIRDMGKATWGQIFTLDFLAFSVSTCKFEVKTASMGWLASNCVFAQKSRVKI
jgi:hypothetical protein